MLRKKRWALNQNGNVTTTGLMILSGVAAATAAIVTINQGLRKSRDLTDQSDLERRLNESALQTVTQLVTNGALHFNETCSRIEPTQEIDASGKSFNPDYTFNGCNAVKPKRAEVNCKSDKSADTNWLYQNDDKTGNAIVTVCVLSTEKRVGVITSEKKPVKVTLTNYQLEKDDQGNERRLAIARSQPQGRNIRGAFYATLGGKISLGLLEGNAGLLGKHGAADTCFYMRPKTSRQTRTAASRKNLAFNARSEAKAYTLSELEPRPEGPSADEFGQNLDVITRAPDGYEILSDLRDTLITKHYKSHFRGNRPATDNWSTTKTAWIPRDVSQGERKRYVAEILSVEKYHQDPSSPQAHFIGVMPSVPNGPWFQYFLAANEGTSQHRQDRKTFNPAFFGEFKQGCATSTGDNQATFCTRVDIPLKTYRAALNNKCKSEKKDVTKVGWQETPNRYFVNRAIQTSCSKEWVDTVEKLLKDEKQELNALAKPGTETTAAMVLAALEADDDFIQKKGNWANHPIREAYDSFAANLKAGGERVNVIDDYTIEYVGDNDEGKMVTKVDKDGNEYQEEEITYVGKDEKVDVYMIQVLDGVSVAEKHEAKSCAYFKYYAPTSAKTCSIAFVTKNDAGFVCRNNDGCFDEKTMIRMADGSDRLVTELRMGEYVYNPVTKKPAKITKLTIGPEFKPLLNITIGTSTVRVTDSHPFMTERGWVAAKNLRKTDRVLAHGGKFVAVDKVEIGQSGRTVANLALEGPAHQEELHYVLADGIVTGDLIIQNMLESRASIQNTSGRK